MTLRRDDNLMDSKDPAAMTVWEWWLAVTSKVPNLEYRYPDKLLLEKYAVKIPLTVLIVSTNQLKPPALPRWKSRSFYYYDDCPAHFFNSVILRLHKLSYSAKEEKIL